MQPQRLILFAVLAALPGLAQPPAPQRTIMENRVTSGKDTGKAQQPAAAPAGTIDSLLDSTEDLNSIRDSYLRRLAGDGCRPDVAVRVAELRSRLEDKGSSDPERSAAAQRTNFEIEGSLLLLAAAWYQPVREAASQHPNRESERARMLEYVLSPETTSAEAGPSGNDRAQVKAELDRLLATCHSAGR